MMQVRSDLNSPAAQTASPPGDLVPGEETDVRLRHARATYEADWYLG